MLISSHLGRTSLVNKGLLYGKNLISRGTQRVIPCGLDSAIFPARVANHSAGFGLSCPPTELEDNNSYYWCLRTPNINNAYRASLVQQVFQVTRNSLKNVGLLNAYVLMKERNVALRLPADWNTRTDHECCVANFSLRKEPVLKLSEVTWNNWFD